MKIVIFFVLCLGLFTFTNAQMSQSEIEGQWAVKKTVTKTSSAELRGVMEGFKSAIFSFSENGDFDLTTESKAPTFQMILRMTENTKWKFDENTQLIRIGNEEDGYSIMGIYPKNEKGTLFFALDESNMTFEMGRIP